MLFSKTYEDSYIFCFVPNSQKLVSLETVPSQSLLLQRRLLAVEPTVYSLKLIAAFRSRSILVPQLLQIKILFFKVKSSFMLPQQEHFLDDGKNLSAFIILQLYHFPLYSSCRLNSYSPKSDIACANL